MTSLKRTAADAERPSKKVKTSRLDASINEQSNDQSNAEIEAARAARKAEKLAKRDQRNERRKIEKELDEELSQSLSNGSIVSTAEQPISAANLRVLLSLKNNTKTDKKPLKSKSGNQAAASSITPPTHAPIYQPITSTLPIEKGQRRKDPAERAAERAARKRARGEPEGEADQSVERAIDHSGVPSHQPSAAAKQSTQSAEQSSTQSGLSVADITAARESADQSEDPALTQSISQARPTWMTGAQFIESTVTTPISELNFHQSINQSLKHVGIESLFAIQNEVISNILLTHQSSSQSHDICVSSPTGSGKTLIYVLSVIQSIIQSINPSINQSMRKLRALVLVPSRDLAVQVKSEFDVHASPLGLKCGLSIGQSSFAKEQRMLVKRSINQSINASVTQTDIYEGLEVPLRTDAIETSDCSAIDGFSYESGVDILVCTPGRLIDHLRLTNGFTLQHLQFLVIDEVDRLLDEHFDAWTSVIHSATQSPPLAYLNTPAQWNGSIKASNTRAHMQKLIFSATLTSDPSKLAALHLKDPLLFIQSQSKQKKFSLPNSLTSQFVLCETSEKPLALRSLLLSLPGLSKRAPATKGPQVLIFTSSLDSAHRLARLMELQGGIELSEYSSLMPTATREKVLKSFRDGSLPVLICSDVISRGLDVTGVTHVINYDLPLSIETYIHRCGRTARAGAKGTAINIVARKEYTWFLSLVKRAANSFMNRVYLNQPSKAAESVDKAAAKPEGEEGEKWSQSMLDELSSSLEQLRQVLKNERRGIQEKHEAIDVELLESDADDDSDNDEEEEEEQKPAPVAEKVKSKPAQAKQAASKVQPKKSSKPSKSS